MANEATPKAAVAEKKFKLKNGAKSHTLVNAQGIQVTDDLLADPKQGPALVRIMTRLKVLDTLCEPA